MIYHMRTITKLRISTFIHRGQWMHIARARCRPSRSPALHTHIGFSELFWVERGPGFHYVNGQRIPLRVGDVVLMREKDYHGLAGANKQDLVLVNVAFDSRVLAFLHDRYFPGPDSWPWSAGKLPATFALPAVAQERLSHWADRASTAQPSRLELEGFLLDVLRLVTRPEGTKREYDILPAWLGTALRLMVEVANLRAGPAGLAKLAEKTPEHVNRMIRRHLGKTTTDLVNEIRMDHAGGQLRMTNRPIMDIALDCGLDNLAYFYLLFKKHHGTTPRRYRLREQMTLLPHA